MLVNAAAVLALVGAATAAPLEARAAPIDQLVGYGAGTTGGGSGAGTTVTTCAQLEAAIAKAGVIKISGTLNGCGSLKVKSNTSFIGVGANSGFTNMGLRLVSVSNIIIRNLKLNTPEAKGDVIALDEATNVWVDHNDFSSKGLTGGKDDYDGLLDITHASDKVTVSWNKFHDHWKGSLVGHSDSNAAEDTGKLHVTYHHNSFINVNSRLPSLRFGSGHIYSNCYQDNPTSGVNSRMGAKVLVEENYFSNTPQAIVTNVDSKEDGYATSKNNIITGTSTTDITQVGAPSITYSYTTDPAANVCSIISASAGTGKVA